MKALHFIWTAAFMLLPPGMSAQPDFREFAFPDHFFDQHHMPSDSLSYFQHGIRPPP